MTHKFFVPMLNKVVRVRFEAFDHFQASFPMRPSKLKWKLPLELAGTEVELTALDAAVMVTTDFGTQRICIRKK
ncbi:hypothetical protein V6N13_064954 [Hibiscus sabdariffa]